MNSMPRSPRSRYVFASCCVYATLAGFPIGVVSAQETLDRTVLPIQEPPRPTYGELDARNAKPPPRFEARRPRERPLMAMALSRHR